MGRRKNPRTLQKMAGFYSDNYWQSLSINEAWYHFYRWRISVLAQNRYRWVNLPNTCDPRYLELTLFLQGRATIAFPMKQKGVFYSTQASMNGRPNIYGYPSRWRSIGSNGWNFNVTSSNGVYLYDNSQRYPMATVADMYARELADIQRTMQINRFHQKIPLVLTGDEDKVLDMTNLAKQMGGGEPMIIGYDSLRDLSIDVLTDKPAPFIGKDLVEAQEATWKQVFETLGVPNLTFKTERMIEDEVSNQESGTSIMLLDGLRERRKAADAINARFEKYLSAPIKVVLNSDWESDVYADLHDIPLLAEIESGDVSE